MRGVLIFRPGWIRYLHVVVRRAAWADRPKINVASGSTHAQIKVCGERAVAEVHRPIGIVCRPNAVVAVKIAPLPARPERLAVDRPRDEDQLQERVAVVRATAWH